MNYTKIAIITLFLGFILTITNAQEDLDGVITFRTEVLEINQINFEITRYNEYFVIQFLDELPNTGLATSGIQLRNDDGRSLELSPLTVSSLPSPLCVLFHKEDVDVVYPRYCIGSGSHSVEITDREFVIKNNLGGDAIYYIEDGTWRTPCQLTPDTCSVVALSVKNLQLEESVSPYNVANIVYRNSAPIVTGVDLISIHGADPIYMLHSGVTQTEFNQCIMEGSCEGNVIINDSSIPMLGIARSRHDNNLESFSAVVGYAEDYCQWLKHIIEVDLDVTLDWVFRLPTAEELEAYVRSELNSKGADLEWIHTSNNTPKVLDLNKPNEEPRIVGMNFAEVGFRCVAEIN